MSVESWEMREGGRLEDEGQREILKREVKGRDGMRKGDRREREV